MSVVPAAGRHFEVTVPVVVIGAGAAGLVAALSACGAGADVLVLERDPIPRGSTAMSAGLIPAAGTRWQRAAHVDDSVARFSADILAKAGGEPDPALVDLMALSVGPALEWLADAYGLPFELVTGFLYGGHTAYRMHGLPSRSGLELVERLGAAAEGAGVGILTDARTETLYAEDDARVRGLTFVRQIGRAHV
jgi:fumarate reductase flavoprotein subunit